MCPPVAKNFSIFKRAVSKAPVVLKAKETDTNAVETKLNDLVKKHYATKLNITDPTIIPKCSNCSESSADFACHLCSLNFVIKKPDDEPWQISNFYKHLRLCKGKPKGSGDIRQSFEKTAVPKKRIRNPSDSDEDDNFNSHLLDVEVQIHSIPDSDTDTIREDNAISPKKRCGSRQTIHDEDEIF